MTLNCKYGVETLRNDVLVALDQRHPSILVSVGTTDSLELDIDLEVWTVSADELLDPGTTKNNEGRVVKYKPISILANLLVACCQGKQASDYVFTRNHRQGKNQPMRDFRGIWGRYAKKLTARGHCSMICVAAQLGTLVRVGSRKA